MYEWLWRAVSLITPVLQTLDSITSGVCVKDREASHVQYLAEEPTLLVVLSILSIVPSSPPLPLPSFSLVIT